MKKWIFSLLIFCHNLALAQVQFQNLYDSEGISLTDNSGILSTERGMLLAKSEWDAGSNKMDVYDPFVDYSEFENTEEEQKVIDFFQTGRFLTLGLFSGVKIFTQNMARLYRLGPLGGGYVNYFFGIDFSTQFIVIVNQNRVTLSSGGQTLTGASNFLSLGVDIKYYFSKIRRVKSLSWFQPFLGVGASWSDMTLLGQSGQQGHYQDRGFGIHALAGVELLISRSIFIALRYSFHYVTLTKEHVPITFGDTVTNVTPSGDWMLIIATLGINF